MNKLKLYNAKGSLRFHVDISQAIDRGGEGLIIPNPEINNQVLKIYHPDITPNLTPQSWTYLNRLGDRFVKPLELFHDHSGKLVGFSMTLLDKSFFRISQIFTKAQCIKLGINGKLKSIIAKELASIITEAHSKNIVIGDFNPYNIFINSFGNIKIIDVDSFETPVLKHSGRLLDEIRDHYYLGTVTQQSDYYALAVNIFRLLTYVHPYKGVHKTCKDLSDRAINRISVLSGNPDLTIPAFYEPVGDKILESQFISIFENGDRFLLQVDQVSTQKVQPIIPRITLANFTVKVIASEVTDFFFNESLGYVKKENCTELYGCTFHGGLNFKSKIHNQDYDHLWLGNKNVIIVSNNKLFHDNEPVTNFEIPENFRFTQMDHLIFGVDWENIYHLYPDKVITKNISWTKIPAWGRGFRFEQSPVQLTGGVARAHFRTDDTVNSVKLPVDAKNLVLHGSVGIITHFEKEMIKHNWFCLNGLNFELSKEAEEIYNFAVKQNGNNTFVFVPKDGKIEVLRTPDFSVVDAIDFQECTSQSLIYLTHSGLLLLENQVLYLLNRK